MDAWFERVRPSYPIAILKNGDFEGALGVRFFPTAGVLDPSGNVVYAGSSGSADGPLGDAMKDARKSALFPKKLDKARAALTEGDVGEAYGEVLAQAGKAGGDEDLLGWCKRFQTLLEQQAVETFERAKAQAEAGLVFRAVSTIEGVTKAKVDFPVSEEARAWSSELSASAGFEVEMKAGPGYEKAREAEKERDFFDAVKQYKALIKKYPDTLLAEAARERGQELIDDGLPGYESSCGDCKDAGRACRKHAKDIEL